LIKDNIDNRKKLRAALIENNIGDIPSMETVEFIPDYTTLYLNSSFEIDLMAYIFGVPHQKFDEYYLQASKAVVNNY